MFRRVLIKYVLSSKTNVVFFKYTSVNSCGVNKFPHTSSLYFANNVHTTNITYNNSHAMKENQFQQENSTNLSEKEFLVKIKDDPDTFGSAADYEPELDPDDIKEEKFISEKPVVSQKLSTKQYADIIKEFLRKRKIKEAIDVLEVKMLKEDRVKPENYIYNLIIGACGRVGYTKKAFSLYNDMKKRALIVTPGTYTALFNACSNSPWATTDGLTRAKHLRNIIIEKMYEPNTTNYNAMIKAFGRGGDLETAFCLVDEMTAKRFDIKDDTLNFLLHACITDKEGGFRHALLVWRKFIDKKIKPSLYSYNLMLRCIRDCGLGDIETTKNVIDQLLTSNQQLLNQPEQRLIGDEQKKQDDEIVLENHDNASENSVAKIQNDLVTSNKPNLMAVVPCLGNILSLTEVTKPEDRLLLVGGCSGFLQNMADNGCVPDIKTFTQLLDNIPSTSAAELNLLQTIKKNKMKPDIDFFNMLIKKRSMRFDYEGGREILHMIEDANLRPNLITYGILALGCKTKEEAKSLLEEMAEANYRINTEILGAMLTQAVYHKNFYYVIYIMDLCNTEEVQPSKLFLEKLEEFKKKCKRLSNDKNNSLSKTKVFQNTFKIFQMRYKQWLQEIHVDESENIHPWQQYRETSDTNVRHYKDKAEKTRFKPVHTNLFRHKTSVKKVKTKK